MNRILLARMLLGTALGTLALGYAQHLMGGHATSVIHFETFLLVFGVTTGFMLIGFSPETIFASFEATFSNGKIDAVQKHKAQRVFSAMGRGFMASGVLAMIIGTIHMLENLANPDAIGPGAAVAIVGLFYGYLAKAAIADPLLDAAQNRPTTNSVQAVTPLPRKKRKSTESKKAA